MHYFGRRRISPSDREGLDMLVGNAMLEDWIAQRLLAPEWRALIVSEHCINPGIQRDLQRLPRLNSLEDFACRIDQMYYM